MAKISTNSSVGMGIIIAAIGGAFGLYSFVQPTFAKVSANAMLLDSQRERMERMDTTQRERLDRLEKSQDVYHEHIIKISEDLSEIRGERKIGRR